MDAAVPPPASSDEDVAQVQAALIQRRAVRGGAGPIGPVAVVGHQDLGSTMILDLPPGSPLSLPDGLYQQHMECAHKTLFFGRKNKLYEESLMKPSGIDLDLWICSHLVQYTEYGRVMFYYISRQLCNEQTCPQMCAGQHVKYTWFDEASGQNVALSASKYIETLLKGSYDYIKTLPLGPPYPPDFKEKACVILKRMFRQYAHVYLNHFDILRNEGCEENINYLFKRFLYFVLDFELVSRADMAPLSHLIAALEAQREHRRQAAQATQAAQVSR